MWRPPFENIDPAIKSTGAALLSAALAYRFSSRRWELQSEVLAWLLLIVLKRSKPARGDTAPASAFLTEVQTTSAPSPRLLWVIAAGIATSSICRSENNLGGSLSALVPLLFISQEQNLPSLDILSSKAQRPALNGRWPTVLGILVTILSLTEWQLRRVTLAVAPALFLFVLYAGLSYKSSESLEAHESHEDFRDLAGLLPSRVAAILIIVLCVQGYWFGFSRGDLLAISFAALIKAVFWHFALQATHHVPWCIVPFINAFGLTSSQSPYIQSSEPRALAHVGASFVVLDQIIRVVPSQGRLRVTLWALLLISLAPYLLDIMAIGNAQLKAERLSSLQGHPVESLISRNKNTFAELLRNQSSTYSRAIEYYKARYRIDPPPGFKAWYEFAVSAQSPIIDEYDMIHDALKPFLKLSGKEVRHMMQQALNEPYHELWSCQLSSKTSKTECTHPYRNHDRHFGLLFDDALKNMGWKLPNITILINHLDEPRLLSKPSSIEGGNPFKLTDLSMKPTWDKLTQYCGHQKRDMANTDIRTSLKTFGLPFVTDSKYAKDLCEHPEYRAMHGLLISPPTFRLIEGLVPVLSTGAFSTMGDILFPSPAYTESDFEYNDRNDPDWEDKRNNLYWAGSNTGGYATNNNWAYFHRQRFVTLAQNLEGARQKYYYLRLVHDVISRISSWFLNGRLFDVAFSQIFSCKTELCRDQSLYFNLRAWAHKDEAFRSRLVFDLDGNGISGRYYKLLASKSTPLKQTLLKEWHDERLVPWVHYVPVSQSMEELPELVTYFTSTSSGQARAREIAEQGREWHFKALREVDFSIYNYRLLLELARLQDPNRKGMP